ncbi:MAG: hypothetical protein IKJ94_05310 [Oscillospiraceae bacterium]|nr:hypothetical protein [Oscillospiraceae bacterium]
MTNYDNDLIRLQQKVALKKQLEAKLNDLRGQRKVYEQEVRVLRIVFENEQEDVQKLESKSLANYFYQIIGKLEDKRTEEQKEAAAARVKLDAAQRELSAVDGEIQDIQSQFSDLYGCEHAYTAALKKKRADVKASGTPAGTEILELEEKLAFLESQKQEIRQARSAGRDALRAADAVLSELKSAQDWNTWDMLGGGGIITHMAKHGHLDDAQANVMALQGMLRKFKTELADINIQANMQVSVDGFLRFADYFFDGLFADWAVGDRISQSQSSVMDVRYKIEQAMNKLTELDQAADKQITALKSQIEELIVHS